MNSQNGQLSILALIICFYLGLGCYLAPRLTDSVGKDLDAFFSQTSPFGMDLTEYLEYEETNISLSYDPSDWQLCADSETPPEFCDLPLFYVYVCIGEDCKELVTESEKEVRTFILSNL